MISPFPPGPAETERSSARVIGAGGQLHDSPRQAAGIVESAAAGGERGVIGTRYEAKSAADGYNLAAGAHKARQICAIIPT